MCAFVCVPQCVCVGGSLANFWEFFSSSVELYMGVRIERQEEFLPADLSLYAEDSVPPTSSKKINTGA